MQHEIVRELGHIIEEGTVPTLAQQRNILGARCLTVRRGPTKP